MEKQMVIHVEHLSKKFKNESALKKIILERKKIKLANIKVLLYPNLSANLPQGTSNNIINII